MEYVFKYTKDGAIYQNGTRTHSLSEFLEKNPKFPIVEGQFFEYRDNEIDLINEHGHHIPQDENDFKALIKAINKLGA